MPRITKAHMKESIVSFANDVMEIIKENSDFKERRQFRIEHNGWHYLVQYSNLYNEIAIIRHNYRPHDKIYLKDQPKGNRISEKAFIYKEGENCTRVYFNRLTGETRLKDEGFLLDGFSIQDYLKSAF